MSHFVTIDLDHVGGGDLNKYGSLYLTAPDVVLCVGQSTEYSKMCFCGHIRRSVKFSIVFQIQSISQRIKNGICSKQEACNELEESKIYYLKTNLDQT